MKLSGRLYVWYAILEIKWMLETLKCQVNNDIGMVNTSR